MDTNHSIFELDHKKLLSSLIKYAIWGGLAIFILSFGFLYLSFELYPQFFETYLDPMFNAGGGRDLIIYLHPFVLSAGLAILWYRFRRYLTGNILIQGLEFGLMYGIVALVPIMWICFGALTVSLLTVFSWLVYGTTQACIAGFVFAWLNTKSK